MEGFAMNRLITLLGISLLLSWGSMISLAEDSPPVDLAELTLEELMDIEVTTVSRKGENLFHAAAAAFVITQDDIRRHGYTSIPEALRLVPGMQVARIDANKWAVSSRGSNGRFANKLLVLIDGRSVYTPLFSGVYWEIQDLVMEDIDRIEVVRGPGATLWGANAVNGIINIITRSAENSPGVLVNVGIGNEERALTSLRYGGVLGSKSHFRVHAKYLNRDESVDTFGNEAFDQWQLAQGGFRLDSELSPHLTWMLQGNFHHGEFHATTLTPYVLPPYWESSATKDRISRGHLLTRWTKTMSEVSEASVQFYYDHTQRETASLDIRQHTYDFDFQHLMSLGERHDFIIGLGTRIVSDDIQSRIPTTTFEPERQTNHVFSGFVQDEIHVARDRLRVTLGSKIEHNDYTDWEIQPNLRALWTPSSSHTLWGAISFAVRTPSRSDLGVNMEMLVLAPEHPANPTTLPTLLQVEGNDDFQAEELLAREIGYRVAPNENVVLDAALFYNTYSRLRSATPGFPIFKETPEVTYIHLPLTADNGMEGEAYGFEIVADWQVRDWWRLRGTYSHLQTQFWSEQGTFAEDMASESSPENQAGLWSSWNLSRDWDVDLGLRYVDTLPAPDLETDIERYLALDARVAVRPWKNLELSLVGQNLTEESHQEAGTPVFFPGQPTLVQRSVYAAATWRY
jgi:iron complex outermembrane receptor protein